MVPHGRLAECIAFLEEGLASVRTTPYHALLGRNFLAQRDDAADFLIRFHRHCAQSTPIEAIYCEMNGFEINTKEWFFDAFGYRKAGDIWEQGWLAEWEYSTDTSMTLQGMEDMQKTFADLYPGLDSPLSLHLADHIAIHLVCARFMELVAAAHHVAKHKYPPLSDFRVLATAHGWDRLQETK